MIKFDKGFSAIEVIFVIVLLLAVAAMSLPLLAGTSSFVRLRADAFAISGKLTEAKFRAATELVSYRVRFDLAQNKYALERHTGGGAFTADGPIFSLSSNIRYAAPADLGDLSAAPANGEQASPPVQSLFIAFNSRGIPVDLSGRPLSDNAIYIRNDRKECFAITVSLAGLAEVWKYRPDGTWALPQ